MLSDECNENGSWKTIIGLISKKATLHVQHTILYISKFPLFCTTKRETCRNFLVTRFTEKRRKFFCSLFSLPLIFTSVAAIISHFFQRRYKIFSLFFQQKMSPLFFISRSSSLSLFSSLSFVGLSPTFSGSLSLPFSSSIDQICGHNNYI